MKKNTTNADAIASVCHLAARMLVNDGIPDDMRRALKTNIENIHRLQTRLDERERTLAEYKARVKDLERCRASISAEFERIQREANTLDVARAAMNAQIAKLEHDIEQTKSDLTTEFLA